MPEEEKKENVRFKAVTEELTIPEIEKQEEVELKEPEKQILAVAGTDNVIELPKEPHDAGIFLKFFLVTFFATLLALALAGGIYVYLSQANKNLNSNSQISNTPSPTTTPVGLINQTATAVPTAIANLASYKLSVLNGTGGIGVAGKARDILEKAGFKVSYIGNADNFNFTDTLIQTKNNISPDVVAQLKNALASTYSVKVGDFLDPASTSDIIVIIGTK